MCHATLRVGLRKRMLIALVLALLFILVVLLFACGVGITPGLSRARPERTRIEESRVRFRPRPRVHSRPRVQFDSWLPAQPGQDTLFRAMQQSRIPVSPLLFKGVTPASIVAEVREAFHSQPPIEGHETIKWDALCRTTGQAHRGCQCDYCDKLREKYGLSQ